MTHARHALLISAAALPLAVPAVMLGLLQGPMWLMLGVAVWVLGVLVLLAVTWRTLVLPANGMIEELDRGSLADALFAVRDIKESAALCSSERARMAELVEDISSSLGEGLLVVAEDLGIRLVSPVALRFCGSEQVRPGTHLLEILRRPEVVEVVRAAAGGERPSHVVVDNPRGLWELRAFPVRHGGAVVLVSDVSLVRRASELRRRFVQDLSHELRSPLAVLRTTVEALEQELPEQLGEIVVRQVERIDRLANELSELASIESGEVELQLEDVEVLTVVKEVVEDSLPEAERAGVTMELEVGEGLACRCDRWGLYRVLSNLVDNAVRYNSQGGWVRIRSSAAGETLVLAVADNGEGIPASELQAVLQRFYRVDRARSPGQGGLGLGLAIVKHMVQRMGGMLELDSRRGVGTTVTLTFPTREGVRVSGG